MINREKLKLEIINAEKGNAESIAVVREVLRPRETDTVEQIHEKISIFIRLLFLSSLKYKSAQFHKEIITTYAEQVQSYLTKGKPRYKGCIFVGYRESAKTTMVKFCELYMTLYLPQLLDSTNIVSEDGGTAEQFNMDMFNMLAFSHIAKYYPDTISLEMKKKKESQTVSKFTTVTGVTYSSSAARKSKRGNVKVDITESGDVETKRPKKVVFDDIENENTIRSFTTSQQIANVMSASMDGLDQVLGSWILLGNYLSLRGNVHKFITKYRNDPEVKVIIIDIMDGLGNPTWEDKYARTDAEIRELEAQGIVKKSIETIERESDNFQVEYMNNPGRSSVYFDDKMIQGLIELRSEDDLVEESERDEDGLLIINEPEKTGVYIVSVDASKGSGGDQTGLTVIQIDGIRFKEVANFKSNKMTPQDFAPYSVAIAKRYNTAMIIPENNYPGNEFIAFLIPIYGSIFESSKKIDANGEVKTEYGVHTNLKSLVHGTGVLTENGWKNIEELVIGDKVFGSDGFTHSVTGVHPQGKVKVWEVETSDGCKIRCSGDHYWSIKSKYYKHGKPRVLKTSELKSDNNKHFIDRIKPVNFSNKDLPIDPYFLGLMLGDGSFGASLTFTSIDEEIINHVSSLLEYPVRILKSTDDNCSYTISRPRAGFGKEPNYLQKHIDKLGLRYRTSKDKFIPDVYKLGSIEQRVELLRGLMDTDGCICKTNKNATYSSISKELAYGVRDLVLSLGGYSKVHFIKNNYNGYFKVTVQLDLFNPFRLKRKAEIWESRVATIQRRNIVSVKELEQEDQMTCISIDSEDSLYVTEDYLLTHNTKPEMFAHAKAVLKDRLFQVQSRSLFTQFSEYPSDEIHKVSQKDGGGGHFDLLMSCIIGLWKAGNISVVKANDDIIDAMLARQARDVFSDIDNVR